MKFIIEQSDEHLTPVARMALVGEIVNHTALKFRLNKTDTSLFSFFTSFSFYLL
ncbi:hypothetical protein MTBGP_03970 [Moorella thermoacetica]